MQAGPPARAARYCTRCGLERHPGARFCARCGARFEDLEAAVAPPAAIAEAPPVVYPVALELPFQPAASRMRSALRPLLALPHVVLWVLLLVLSLVTTPLAWLASLATGRQPRALRRLHGVMLRYVTRTAAYLALATDAAPAWPWNDGGAHPVAVAVPDDMRLPRLRTLVIWPLSIPAVLTAILFGVVTVMLAIGAWVAILATGRLPRTIHDMQRLALGFQCRTLAHVPLLLMAKYPWYEREGGLIPVQRYVRSGPPPDGGPASGDLVH